MAIYRFGGGLLRVPGGLARTTNCCCAGCCACPALEAAGLLSQQLQVVFGGDASGTMLLPMLGSNASCPEWFVALDEDDVDTPPPCGVATFGTPGIGLICREEEIWSFMTWNNIGCAFGDENAILSGYGYGTAARGEVLSFQCDPFEATYRWTIQSIPPETCPCAGGVIEATFTIL